MGTHEPISEMDGWRLQEPELRDKKALQSEEAFGPDSLGSKRTSLASMGMLINLSKVCFSHMQIKCILRADEKIKWDNQWKAPDLVLDKFLI